MLQRVMGSSLPAAQMEKVVSSARAKYELIGGKSPSVEIAETICVALKAALDKAGEKICAIEVGMGFSEPFIEDAIERLADTGCKRIIYFSLTAFESWVAWEGPYQHSKEVALKQGISEVVKAPVFGPSSAYLNAHADNIRKAYFDLVQHAYQDDASVQEVNLAFVAHSLPIDDDQEMSARYEQQLLAAASLLITGMPMPFESGTLCYVSAGARGGKWLEPSLDTIFSKLALRGADTLIVCPLGFATDHMEVLYDLDIAAVKKAKDQDITLIRTPTLATLESINPGLIESFVASVQSALVSTP